jgi:hypothetical protein
MNPNNTPAHAEAVKADTERRMALAQDFTVHVKAIDHPHFASPEVVMDELDRVLVISTLSFQRMKVELHLPLYLWSMLAEIEGPENIGEAVSNLLYCSPEIRAKWIQKNTWENELLPRVVEELKRSEGPEVSANEKGGTR